MVFVKVLRTGGAASNVTVNAIATGGTAVDGTNFVAATNRIAFGSRQTSNVVAVTIRNDLVAAGNKTVILQLRHPTGGATLGTLSNATLTILAAEIPVEGEYRFAGTNTYAGFTNPAWNGKVSLGGSLTLHHQLERGCMMAWNRCSMGTESQDTHEAA